MIARHAIEQSDPMQGQRAYHRDRRCNFLSRSETWTAVAVRVGVAVAVALQGAGMIRVHDVAAIRDAILACRAVLGRGLLGSLFGLVVAKQSL